MRSWLHSHDPAGDALRRALRAALVIPIALAVATNLVGGAQVPLFAVATWFVDHAPPRGDIDTELATALGADVRPRDLFWTAAYLNELELLRSDVVSAGLER